MRVEPLGGRTGTKRGSDLGHGLDASSWTQKPASSMRGRFPGVTDTSGVDEATGAAPFEPPSATY